MEEYTGERCNYPPFMTITTSFSAQKEALNCKINFLISIPFLPQFTLGGFEQLQTIKVHKREELGLPPLPEDSIRVIRSMRAASPPASASDLIEQQQKRARREHKVGIQSAACS